MRAQVPAEWRQALVRRGEFDRFLFAPDDLIVAVGQDGLVANVAKYLDGQPVLPEAYRNFPFLVTESAEDPLGRLHPLHGKGDPRRAGWGPEAKGGWVDGREVDPLRASRDVAKRAYAPYSGFPVGAAALTFMLAAPAINPVVVVSTVVAFPGQPRMVVARVAASVLTAIVMGLMWSRWGRMEWITRRLPRTSVENGSRWHVFTEAARHDFIQAASYLVVGAVAAAVLHVVVPGWLIEHLATHLLLGTVVMATLAVVLALCSEADAFVAASLTMVPLLPRLVFLVVGPAVDVKLFAMQSGIFGRGFAIRFAPATFVVATVIATGVGGLILGSGS
mgnify:CR=1 FL=1